MSVKTQGTVFFALVPKTGELLDIGCVTAIDGIDTTIENMENTCLNALVRTYEAGMATPGTATFTIYTDPSDPNHIRLHQLKVAGTTLHWAVGFRQEVDGVPVVPGAVPTAVVDEPGSWIFELPGERAWIAFEGHMSAFPFSLAQNSFVQSNISVQISGEPQLVPAEPEESSS
jgi:hypothetical protein